jgi:hypothetical protein
MDETEVGRIEAWVGLDVAKEDHQSDGDFDATPHVLPQILPHEHGGAAISPALGRQTASLGVAIHPPGH